MLDPALAGGRAAAESRMKSTATVRRKSGTTTDADGFEVPAWPDVHVDIPCRIAGMSSMRSFGRTSTVGGVAVQVATRIVHFPSGTTDLRNGDLIEVTAGEVAGTVWRIVEADPADQQTARRVPVESITRPTEWGP